MSETISNVDENLIESNYHEVAHTFDDLNLKEEILRGM